MLAFLLATAALVYSGYLLRFARVTPGEDFMGDVVYVEKLVASLGEGRLFRDWIAEETFGRPSTVQRGSALLFLGPASLVLLGFQAVTAAKIVLATLHTLSFATFYFLARKMALPRWASVLGATAYLLCPLHLDSFFRAGHWQLGWSYCLSPLLVGLTFSVAKKPSPPSVALLALTFASLLLSDNERTVTLLPLLPFFTYLGLRDGSQAPSPPRSIRNLLSVIAAFILGALLSLAGTGPLFLARHTLALAHEAGLFSIHHGHFVHPLYFFDHGRPLYVWGLAAPQGSDGFHGGWLLTLGSLLPLSLLGSKARTSGTSETPVRVLFLALVTIYWLAASSPAWWASSLLLFPSAPLVAGMFTAMFACVYVALVLLVAKNIPGSWRVGLVLGLALLPFLSARSLLAHLPVVGAIENLRWFAQVNQPLLAALLVAYASIWLNDASELVVRVALSGLALLFFVDHTLNRPIQSEWDAASGSACDALASDPVKGRYLHYPYVESDWREAAFARHTNRANAGSWLLWSGTRGGVGRFAKLQDALRALEGTDEPKMRLAAEEAARLDVRYLVLRGRAQLGRAIELGILHDQGGGIFQLAAHHEASLVRGNLGPLSYERPVNEVLIVPGATTGRLSIAEAFNPGWSARLNGMPVAVQDEQGMMSVDLSRAGNLVLTFAPPASDRWFRWMSICTGALVLVLLAWGRRTRIFGCRLRERFAL